MTLTVLIFWVYFYLPTLAFVLQWLSIHWEILIMLFSQNGMPYFIIQLDYSFADWDGLHDHVRDVPWEDILKLCASAAAREFCEWVQAGIDVIYLSL